MEANASLSRDYATAKRSAIASESLFQGIEKSKRAEHFDRSIILNRLFANQPENWVLKGASALIWRDASSRATRDLDLLRLGQQEISQAYKDLQTALDHPTTAPFDVRFRVSEPRTSWNPDQGHTQVSTVKVTLLSDQGKTLSQPVKIDMVIGDHMTDKPETISTQDLATVLRSEPHSIQVYPIHDHLADKIAATFKLYGENPSTRVRDLADIAHIASTQSLSLQKLNTALEAVRHSSGSAAYPLEFTVPSDWKQRYARMQQNDAPHAPSFEEALTKAQALVNPVLSWDGKKEMTWSKGQWRENVPNTEQKGLTAGQQRLLGQAKAPAPSMTTGQMRTSAELPRQIQPPTLGREL
jgi:predicted nucleotidyltransferase component of viral defense system